MSVFLSEDAYWSGELRKRAARANIAIEFLRTDDVAALGDVALCGAFIARRILEEAKNAEGALNNEEYVFNKAAVLRLMPICQKTISLKGCWNFKENMASPKLALDAGETLTYFDLFSQVIHADNFQLWKSHSESDPCFWFASPKHSHDAKRKRFYRITWSKFGTCLTDVADGLSVAS